MPLNKESKSIERKQKKKTNSILKFKFHDRFIIKNVSDEIPIFPSHVYSHWHFLTTH